MSVKSANIINQDKRSRVFILPLILIITIIIGLVISALIGRFDLERKYRNQQIQVLSDLSTIRAQLEGVVFSTFNLTQGIVHLISYQNDISRELFDAMSKKAISEIFYIRHIALAPDNEIRWVYPLAGNEKAVGLKYIENDEQRESVINAMRVKKPILAGPVNLVQGGRGFINRAPIYVNNNYWGIISIVAYVDSILVHGGVTNSKTNRILLRGKDGKGEYGDIIWGDSAILRNNPVLLDVTVPGGKWQLAAVPLKGWSEFSLIYSTYFQMSLLLTFILCTFFYILIRANNNIRKKNLELAFEISERVRIEKELVKSKEAAESANKMKTVFLANMSHEIRTPMNSILGFSDLMLNRDISIDVSNKYLEIINTSTKQLLSVINDIIDISIIESNQLKIYSNLVNVNSLLNNIQHLNFNSAKKKGLDLIMRVGLPNNLASIYSDEHRLSQVLNNLVNNAIKYTPRGNIEIGYVLKNDFLEFFVKDTGLGIAPEFHHSIFEMFRQLDDNNSSNFGGVGLGLAISRSIVEKMGGKIWVTSELNVGSVFKFTIPYHYVNITESRKIPEKTIYKLDLTGKTILIAEDNESSYLFLEGFFIGTNANILWAKNGFDTFELLKTKQVDLLLLDIKMPGMSGIEVIKEIRKKNTSLSVIAQSAFAMAEDKDNAIKAGCDYYITKPIDPSFLYELIRMIFEK